MSDPWNKAAELAARRANIERCLIVHLLRNRIWGLQWAKGFGITPTHFDQPDLQVMYIAIDYMAGRPLIDCLQACKFVLQKTGRWDNTAPRHSTGMDWSDVMLAKAATPLGRPCPGLIPLLCIDLLELAEVT